MQEQQNGIPTRRYAAIHVVSFRKIYEDSYGELDEETGERYEVDESPEDFTPTGAELEKTYKGIIEKLRRGDIIEDSDNSGYRSQGVWFWNGNVIVGQHYDFDDYGSPSTEFETLWDFPPDYWHVPGNHSGNHVEELHEVFKWSGNDSQFYWHMDSPVICLDDSTREMIEMVLKEPSLLIDLAGEKWLMVQTSGHAVNLIQIPQNWESTGYVCNYPDNDYNAGVWEEARKKFPKLRSISTVEYC